MASESKVVAEEWTLIFDKKKMELKGCTLLLVKVGSVFFKTCFKVNYRSTRAESCQEC